MKTIAILNGKGGVGKTTTTMNLGTALWLLGKRVLLVDCDPQCNLSVTVDKTSFQANVATLYEWMQSRDIKEVPVYERYPGLEYIPANPRMEELNRWLVDKARREDYLANRLRLISDNYDYILLDCAPAVESLINMNVLVASDAVIVPTRTDFYGVQSQAPLMMRLNEVREVFGKELPVLGYLLTQYEKTKADKEIGDYFKEQDNIRLFRPIRKCSACRGALPRQMSLYEYDPSCTAADDYMMLAEKIVGRQTRPKKWLPSEWGRKARTAYESFIKEQEEQ